jgi:uncharacterized protein YjbJ (UPF0337 family)
MMCSSYKAVTFVAFFAVLLTGFAGTALSASWPVATAPAVVMAEPSPELLRLVVNEDQFKGNWKQFKGELKRQYGKLTDDDLMEIEGNYDKFQGKLQERYGDRKEEVNRWTESWFEKNNRKSR